MSTQVSKIGSYLELSTSTQSNYQHRTKVNAESADCTLYLYNQRFFDSSGMRLTRNHSKNFIPMLVSAPVDTLIAQVVAALPPNPSLVINFAGNAVSRFPVDTSQQDINLQVYNICWGILQYRSIAQIRSGGQTGADWAGLVAAVALQVDAIGFFPSNYRQRVRTGTDITSTRSEIFERLMADVAALGPVDL